MMPARILEQLRPCRAWFFPPASLPFSSPSNSCSSASSEIPPRSETNGTARPALCSFPCLKEPWSPANCSVPTPSTTSFFPDARPRPSSAQRPSGVQTGNDRSGRPSLRLPCSFDHALRPAHRRLPGAARVRSFRPRRLRPSPSAGKTPSGDFNPSFTSSFCGRCSASPGAGGIPRFRPAGGSVFCF